MNFLDDLLAQLSGGNGQTPWAKEQMARMLQGGMAPEAVAGGGMQAPSFVSAPKPMAGPMPVPSAQTGGQPRPPAAPMSQPMQAMSTPEPASASPATYISGALNGAARANNPLGAIVGALGGALGAGEDVNQQNQTYRLLTAKGIAPEDAALAVKNPQVMQMLLAQAYAKQGPVTLNPGQKVFDPRTGKVMFDNSESVKPTNDMAEYKKAVEQGFTGTFFDYQVALKKAGASSTLITTDNRAENAEAKARGEGLGKRLNTIADDGIEAQRDMVTLQRLSQLAGNVDPGTKTALLEEIRNLTGITLDPNTDNVQAFKAAANYLAPRMRVAGSGASSDRDVAIFFKALPGLLGTPGGNQLAIETLGGMAQARMEASRIAQAWQRGEIDAAEADKRMMQLKDPFQGFKEKSGGMALDEARQAIAKGAPRDAVIQRLRERGIDPGGL